MARPNLNAFALCIALLSAPSGVAAQEPVRGVSELEAQELSVHELASRVLGDVGATLVIDVDRPAWGSDPGAWARQRGASPPSVPSPLSRLVFYAQPIAASFGMCEQLLITVEFAMPDQNGSRQLPVNIQTESRFGVVSETTPPEGFFTSEYRTELDTECARQAAGRDYFPAHDRSDANYVTRITQHMAALGEANQTPPFPFTCLTFRTRCTDASTRLASLNWREIRSVDAVPCTPGPHRVQWPKCFEIVYGIAMENGRRVQTLGYHTLHVVAGFPRRELVIESAELRFNSAVP